MVNLSHYQEEELVQENEQSGHWYPDHFHYYPQHWVTVLVYQMLDWRQVGFILL